VLRLLDAQHHTLDVHPAGISHVVIDIADIREDHADGLDILGRAHDIAHAEGCTLHLAGCSARSQAFDLLRIVSQSTNRKLAELALEVGETGILPYRSGSTPPALSQSV
jgi:hypothetical protein